MDKIDIFRIGDGGDFLIGFYYHILISDDETSTSRDKLLHIYLFRLSNLMDVLYLCVQGVSGEEKFSYLYHTGVKLFSCITFV